MSWSEYYEENLSFVEHIGNIAAHAQFIEEIMSFDPDSVIEIGCGTGSMSIFLSSMVNTAVGIDQDEEVVETAKQNNNGLNGCANFNNVKASEAIGEYDVAFSQGLLEHFNDSKIRNIVDHHLRLADVAVISVPARMYGVRDFGNERLMSKEKWREILSEYEVRFVYYGHRKNHLMERFTLSYKPLMRMMKGLVEGERPQLMMVVGEK